MALHTWWSGDRTERYWMETTDRAVLGVDLAAPQTDDAGHEHHGYALVAEVERGDVVLHYHTDERAIVAWSRATGSFWEENITWASHGTVAREAGVLPYDRPGYRHGLDGPFWLTEPVTLEEIRGAEADLRTVREMLRDAVGDPLYFPFALSESRPVRPTQFYLTKFPSALVEAFPSLANEVLDEDELLAAETSAAPVPDEFGVEYVIADENIGTSERDPFEVDPAVVDRSLRAHAMVQNALASYVQQCGYDPVSPSPGDPKFDLGWGDGDRVWVAEVKSLRKQNEEQQLRLGLGQVLRYRYLLEQRYSSVEAVLAVEYQPSDPSWLELCSALGVTLCWSSDLNRLKL